MDSELDVELVVKWFAVAKKAKEFVAAEKALRVEIVRANFADIAEGTGTLTMADGYRLKATKKLNRTLDAAALPSVLKALPEGTPVDVLIDYKPALVMAIYKRLTEEARLIFDQALVVKPGLPSLDIVAPKKKGGGA